MIPCAFVLYPDNLKDSHPSEGAVYESTSPIAVPDAGSGKVLEFTELIEGVTYKYYLSVIYGRKGE